MPLRRPSKRIKPEPTIALINVVFLILIFFMVAGALARPLDGRVNLVSTAALAGRAPPDALVILPTGEMTWAGTAITAQGVAARLRSAPDATLRIVPDRALPVALLMARVGELGVAGVDQIALVTERGLR